MIRMIAALSAMMFLAAPALANDNPEREIKYKERTEIIFDGVDVQGELVKPQGKLTVERRSASFNPLIQLREDFNREMKDSVDEVK